MPKLPSVSLPFVKKSQTRSQTRAQRLASNLSSATDNPSSSTAAATNIIVSSPSPQTCLEIPHHKPDEHEQQKERSIRRVAQTRPTNQASTSALIYQPQPPTGLMASLLFSAKRQQRHPNPKPSQQQQHHRQPPQTPKAPSPSQLKSASNHSSTNPTPSIRPSYPENSGSITSPSLIRESENFSRRELFDPPHPIFHSSHNSDKHQPLPSEIPDTNHSQFNPPNAQSQMENSAQAFLGVHPSSADSIHLKLGETMLCDLQKSSPPLISLSPIGQPLLDSNIKQFSTQTLSPLRRHHTLSTSSGSRLARLEKHHALASMAEKDRKFYAQSNESSSLSGKESDEGIAALGGSNQNQLQSLQSNVNCSSIIDDRSPRLSDSSEYPFEPNPSFQVIRAYKTTSNSTALAQASSALSHHHHLLGSPDHFKGKRAAIANPDLSTAPESISSSPTQLVLPLLSDHPHNRLRDAASSQHRLVSLGQSSYALVQSSPSASSFSSSFSSPPSHTSQDGALVGEGEGEGEDDQSTNVFKSRKTYQSRDLSVAVSSYRNSIKFYPPGVSTSSPLYSQVALHRNFSSPSKLQHNHSPATSAASPLSQGAPAAKSYNPSSSWDPFNSLNLDLTSGKSTESTTEYAETGVSSHTNILSSSLRIENSADETRESLEEALTPPSPSCHTPCPALSRLHRTTSDRVPSTTGSAYISEEPGSCSTEHPWSEQANLRRHRSMKSNGKWGICVLTGPTPNSGQQSLSAQPKDLALARLDAFYELSSPIVGPSTGILPTKTLCDHLSSTGNTISLSKKPTRSVTPIGSPASVSTFAANPWSPSLEERRKLREPILRQASLDTLASAESMSPRKTKNSNSEAAQLMCSSNNESGSEDLQMLHTNFNRINVTSGKGGSEDSNSRPAIGAQSHRMYGTRSPLSNSTSIADLTENLSPDSDGDPKTNPTSASSNKKVPLPPLVTNFSRQTSSPVSVGKSQTQNSAGPTRNSSDEGPLPFRGPASAAAYVPPIGHSLSRNINDPFNLKGKLAFAASHNTAAPGITASNWLSQKERFVGSSLGRSQFNSEWSPAIDTSGVSQLPSATSLGNLPQQIQQQFIIGQQLQQLQQLQAQQQLLQQHQAQILTRALGIPPSLPSALPSSAYNPQTLSGSNLIGSSYSSVSSQPPTLVAAPGYNLSPTPASRSGDAVSSPANSNMIATPPPNPSRLQTTITGLPGLTTNFNGVSPRVISNSLDGGGSLLNFTNSVSGSYVKPIVDVTHGQATPISADVQELARLKGYNPAQFNLQPKNARFFVIKSYTEEDVHKSLKYEIWASTTLGNRRLDRAFNESSELGPIYLLFSVNGSGHFCGMAEMMTAVDYNTTSKVWAQDKWKGIFKVRWIFVKDIPNNSLRHIKLTNTPENKPVTSSRDTQEVPYEKGVQILQIMSSFQSRTSLLQDYAWYEHNESHKVNQQDNGQFINLSTAISQKLGSDMINSSN